MTRVLAGALRDSRGVRVCPRGCSGITACQAAKRKTVAPGVTLFTPPAQGTCSMFYNPVTKEPT